MSPISGSSLIADRMESHRQRTSLAENFHNSSNETRTRTSTTDARHDTERVRPGGALRRIEACMNIVDHLGLCFTNMQLSDVDDSQSCLEMSSNENAHQAIDYAAREATCLDGLDVLCRRAHIDPSDMIDVSASRSHSASEDISAASMGSNTRQCCSREKNRGVMPIRQDSLVPSDDISKKSFDQG